ncbi:Bug family tripartite tricarboxylate transporter substrate binding protein [Ottowia thiooxydans]|uniref:Bug family tripartite tricarboxylate transporter substrate binding protein n=1 Tax=Ottowia thiooxydans TaxID=219182 RepID=UPI0004283618|nr:tripartite tricarboxylate transporter substrate binding protein [Ottowia thiooxydans]
MPQIRPREASAFGRCSYAAARLLLTALAPLAALPVVAQSYPDKAIRMVVPFPPGGGVDATARMIGKRLSDAFGQPVLIDNRPGANGSIGAGAVTKAPADGYTLLFADRGAFGVNPSLYKKLAYDPLKDFAYIGIATWSPYVLVAAGSLPVKDLAQMVPYAKQNACKLNYASFGIGSMAQMGMESLNAHYGTCISHVPYKGGGPAVMATVGGEVQFTLSTIAAVLPHIKDGRLKALAVGAPNRSPLLPQTPTVAESGGQPDLLPQTYFGFALPANTPAPIVARLGEEIRRIVGIAEVRDSLMKGGFEPADVSAESMARTVKEDVARFARLAQTIGIQPE